MTRQLVFVHGRAQENKEALALKQHWINAWKEGLGKSGLAIPLADADIRFPYYGDTLDQMARGMSAEEAARVIVKGIEDLSAQQEFFREFMSELQDQAGISDAQVLEMVDAAVIEKGAGNWAWVQGVLSFLDQKVPLASSASIALFTNDVFKYLNMAHIHAAMNEGVRSAFTEGKETVVVAHSLGTVITYNVLSKARALPALKVPQLITLGSPLAVRAIKKSLRPIRHPACVGHWFNAMDERDLVSLFPLTPEYFDVTPAIENKTDVDNNTHNRHGISGYLSDQEVAKRIYDAVTAL